MTAPKATAAEAKSESQQWTCLTQAMKFDLDTTNMPFKVSISDFDGPYALVIGESGEYLMTIHKSTSLVGISARWSTKLWLATVYHDTNFTRRSLGPSYRYISSLAFKPHCTSGDFLSVEDAVVLHPTLPLAGIVYCNILLRRDGRKGSRVVAMKDNLQHDTVLWNYSSSLGESLKHFHAFLRAG